MWKKVILGIIGATTLSLGGVAIGGLVLTDKEANPLTVTNIPEKIDTQSQTINFGDVPPHTTTVDSAGLISIDVGDKRYTIEPLKLESDKAEGTKAKSPALKIESDGDDVYIKEAWGATSEIKLTNTREAFSKVVSFSQNDFKSLARGTKYIEVKFEITGFEVPDGIYSNRIEIQPNVWLEKGKAWDSSPGDEANDIPNQNYTDVEFEVIGNTLIKRIPIEWFNSATFPVYTDAVFTFGTKELANAASSGQLSTHTIGTDKLVMCWPDVSDAAAEGKCQIASVTGTDITYGASLNFVADVGLFTSSSGFASCGIADDLWVVFYLDDADTDDLTARVASSTGTTINGYGTALDISTATSDNIGDCTRVGTSTVVFAYGDSAGSDYQAIACTISATYTLSCGAVVDLQNDAAGSIFGASCVDLDTNKFSCFWTMQNSFSRMRVGTVSGTTITLGTVKEVYNSSSVITNGHNIVSPATNKFLINWNVGAINGMALGTVSGTTITLGVTTTPLHSTTTSIHSLTAIDSDSAFWMGQYGATDGINTYLAAIPIELNYGTLTFSSSTPEIVDTTTDPGSLHAAKISDCKFAFAWEDDNDTNDLFAIIGDTAGCVVDSVRDSGIIWFD